MEVLLKNVRLIDEEKDERFDILIEKDNIKIEKEIKPNPKTKVIEKKSIICCPSFVDIHVHFRDPGELYKEDLLTGSKAAVFGGYTKTVCMPNTKPPLDNEALIEYIKLKSEKIGICDILPSACITKGREGKELTDFYTLKKAGAIFFSDDGNVLENPLLMQKALEISAEIGSFIADHCESSFLIEKNGSINEGLVSALWGVPSRNPSAEDYIVARDLTLSYHTKGHIHIQHISSHLSLDLIRFFKEKGTPVSSEVNPNHLIFTEKDVLKYGPIAKVNPPFREEKDQRALLEGIKDGTIDIVATDHAPHKDFEKRDILSAKPGLIGLQTSLPIMLFIKDKINIPLKRVIELLSLNPRKLLKLETKIDIKDIRDLVIFDEDISWGFSEEINPSKSKNTPLINKDLKGKVLYTIKNKKVVYSYG